MENTDIFAQLNQVLDNGGDVMAIVVGGRRHNNNTRGGPGNARNNKPRGNTTRNVSQDQTERVYRLLEGVPEDIKHRFQFDAVASWSITNMRIAREFAATLLRIIAKPNPIITDSMACVGGNSIAFAETFAYVNANELDPARSRMLANNLRLFGRTNATVFNDYAQTIIPTLMQDAIFFDPPWGTDYKKYAPGTMKIYLGGPNTNHELFDDIAATACQYASFIAMKLPVNYAVDDLVAAMLPAREIHRECHGKPNTSLLLVFGV